MSGRALPASIGSDTVRALAARVPRRCAQCDEQFPPGVTELGEIASRVLSAFKEGKTVVDMCIAEKLPIDVVSTLTSARRDRNRTRSGSGAPTSRGSAALARTATAVGRIMRRRLKSLSASCCSAELVVGDDPPVCRLRKITLARVLFRELKATPFEARRERVRADKAKCRQPGHPRRSRRPRSRSPALAVPKARQA